MSSGTSVAFNLGSLCDSRRPITVRLDQKPPGAADRDGSATDGQLASQEIFLPVQRQRGPDDLNRRSGSQGFFFLLSQVGPDVGIHYPSRTSYQQVHPC